MRRTFAVIFALLAFNAIFFPFQSSHLGLFLTPRLGSIGFALFIMSFQIFQYLAFYNSEHKMKNKYAFAASTISIATVVLSLIRTSAVDSGVLGLTALVFSLISLYTLIKSGDGIINSFFELITSPLVLLYEWFRNFVETKANLLEVTKPLDKVNYTPKGILRHFDREARIYLFIGLLVAVPIVGIIVALLSSADPIFAKFVANFFKLDLKNFPWWIVSRLFSTFAALFIVLAFAFMRATKTLSSPLENTRLARFGMSMVVVVVLVALVLGAFIVVEFPYLFTSVPETELHKFGVQTYSEYVRKGFTELTLVSVIVYLTTVISVSIYKLSGRANKYLGFLNILLLSETGIFIVSILRRVYLYQINHGLTRVRVYGSLFLILLIFLTLMLVLRHLRRRVNWYIYEVALVVAFVLSIFFVRPDNAIATKYKPTVNNEVDYVYISRLSLEGVDGWIEAYKFAKSQVDKYENDLADRDMTPDQKRQLYYSNLILAILKPKYRNLAYAYGSEEDKKAFGIGDKLRPSDIKEKNIGEINAYRKLREAIDPTELIEYERKSYTTVNAVPVNELRDYRDRSLNSPLLQEVPAEVRRF